MTESPSFQQPATRKYSIRMGWPDFIILVIWGLLYLPHLRVSPTWYGDETFTFDIARNLVHGVLAWGPVWNTFGGPYQWLYIGLAGIFSWFTGGDILGARFFSALLALLTALLLWRLGRRVFGGKIAFPTALFFLAYPQTIIHFRQVYPHDGLVFGVTLAFLAICRRAGWKNDLTAGFGLLMAAGSHLLAVYSGPVILLARLKRPRSWFWLALPGAIFFGIFFSFVIWRFHGWLLEDILAVGKFYKADASQHGNHLGRNLWIFFTQDWFHLFGCIGVLASLFQRRARRFWPWAAAFGIYSVALLSNRSNLVVFYYQAVILLPFLAMGNAVLLGEALRFCRRAKFVRTVSLPDWKKICRLASAALPLIVAAASVLPSIMGTLKARNHPWATQSTEEVEATAAWLNQRTSDEDVVLSNSNLAWLLKAKWANLLSFAAWRGYATFMHDYGTPQERFRYSLDTSRVKYAVIGDIDQRWTLGQPHVLEVLRAEGVDRWPTVFALPHYFVLQNPNYRPAEEN